MKFIIWIILFIFFNILEVLTPGTFYFTCISIGFLAAGISSFFITSIIFQWIIFAIFAILSIIFLKPLANRINKRELRMANVESLIGKKARVIQDIIPELNQGLIVIEGEQWRVKANEKIPKNNYVEITGIEGTHLTVKKLIKRR